MNFQQKKASGGWFQESPYFVCDLCGPAVHVFGFWVNACKNSPAVTCALCRNPD